MHSLIKNEDGTTLIEVLLATVLAVIVVVTLSLAFPLASKNVSQSRQRWEATHIASTQMTQITNLPYAQVSPTDFAATNLDPANTLNCDCAAANLTPILSNPSQNAGTTFQVASCVNYVAPPPAGSGNSWVHQCPVAGDTSYKNILVRVYWTNGSETHFVTQEASMTQL